MGERYYKISEVARMFGLTAEALRFYERKGLLQPRKSPENRYRYYELRDIYRLWDILFFRRLDMGLEEIGRILTACGVDDMTALLRDKQLMVQAKIQEQTQLLKKLEMFIGYYSDIKANLGQLSFRPLGPAYVLAQGEDCTLIDALVLSSRPGHELCQILQRPADFAFTHLVLTQQLAADLKLIEDLADKAILYYPFCAHTMTALKANEPLTPQVARLADFMAERDCVALAEPLCTHLTSAVSQGQTLEFYEIYWPCAKKA